MSADSAGGESQGGAMEASGRHLDAEEGLYLPEPDRASLHDSEGLLNVTTTLVWTNQNVCNSRNLVCNNQNSCSLDRDWI